MQLLRAYGPRTVGGREAARHCPQLALGFFRYPADESHPPVHNM